MVDTLSTKSKQKRVRSVALYSKAIIAGGVIVSGLEIAALIVHLKLKDESIDHCRTELKDEDDQQKVNEWCDSDWKRGIYVHAIWMAVIIVLASIFIALWWRFKGQVQTNAYQVGISLWYHLLPAHKSPRYRKITIRMITPIKVTHCNQALGMLLPWLIQLHQTSQIVSKGISYDGYTNITLRCTTLFSRRSTSVRR